MTGLARHGAEISPATLAGTPAQAAGLRAPRAAAIADLSRDSWHFHADETTWRVLCPGEGKGPAKFWLWVFIGADTVCFVMELSRSRGGAGRARWESMRRPASCSPHEDGGLRRLVISSDFHAGVRVGGQEGRRPGQSLLHGAPR